MPAVRRAKRHAVAGNQRSASEGFDIEDVPRAWAAGCAVGAHAAAAAAFGHEKVGPVVGPQHDARLERAHEQPLGFLTVAQPVFEKWRPIAEIDAELRVEAPCRGAGELRVRDGLQKVLRAVVRRIEEEGVARRHRLLHVDDLACLSQDVDRVFLNGERVPVRLARFVEHVDVQTHARHESHVERRTGVVAAGFGASDDARGIDRFDGEVNAPDIRLAQKPAVRHVALVLDVDHHVVVRAYRRDDIGDADERLRRGHTGVLVGESEIDDEALEFRLIENRQKTRELAGAD